MGLTEASNMRSLACLLECLLTCVRACMFASLLACLLPKFACWTACTGGLRAKCMQHAAILMAYSACPVPLLLLRNLHTPATMAPVLLMLEMRGTDLQIAVQELARLKLEQKRLQAEIRRLQEYNVDELLAELDHKNAELKRLDGKLEQYEQTMQELTSVQASSPLLLCWHT